jgi:hypothetical protein
MALWGRNNCHVLISIKYSCDRRYCYSRIFDTTLNDYNDNCKECICETLRFKSQYASVLLIWLYHRIFLHDVYYTVNS